jgi:hypothetical protein
MVQLFLPGLPGAYDIRSIDGCYYRASDGIVVVAERHVNELISRYGAQVRQTEPEVAPVTENR